MFSRILAFVEYVGSAALAFIAAMTFVSVLMRYVFNAPIPDTFDFSRLLMGTVILWGLATASYRGEHIQFQLIWEMAGPRARRGIDLLATLTTFGAVCVLTVTLGERIYDSYLGKGTTSGLGVPLWPFHLAAWIGACFATVLLAARTTKVVAGRDADKHESTKDGVT